MTEISSVKAKFVQKVKKDAIEQYGEKICAIRQHVLKNIPLSTLKSEIKYKYRKLHNYE